jgi:ABC-type sulfate transport system substrate-binding protein
VENLPVLKWVVRWCRPVLPHVAKEAPLPPVKSTWTVEQKLKGWDAAQAKFFKVSATNGVVVSQHQ